MQDKKTPSNWGGHRERSGRKKSKNPRVTLSVRIDHRCHSFLVRFAKETRISRGRALDIILGSYELDQERKNDFY